eukprot:3367475-Rhodomonas_salina.1
MQRKDSRERHKQTAPLHPCACFRSRRCVHKPTALSPARNANCCSGVRCISRPHSRTSKATQSTLANTRRYSSPRKGTGKSTARHAPAHANTERETCLYKTTPSSACRTSPRIHQHRTLRVRKRTHAHGEIKALRGTKCTGETGNRD